MKRTMTPPPLLLLPPLLAGVVPRLLWVLTGALLPLPLVVVVLLLVGLLQRSR